MSAVLASLIASGFFASEAVRIAAGVGTLVAVVAGAVGVFTVMRGQSFAGEALGDVATTGGAGAFRVGVGSLWGIVAADLVAVAVMELIGVQRPRGRDLATGIVLSFALGLSALLFYLDTTVSATTGATQTVLFGSAFTISTATLPLVGGLGAAALALIALLYRPLLLSSLNAEIAAARGVPVRAIGALYLLALAMAVALASVTIGTILATALLIGPAATALRLTRRPWVAIAVAGTVGVAAVWVGVLLAYDSYYWPPHAWPLSFFVVVLVFLAYLASGIVVRVRERRRERGDA